VAALAEAAAVMDADAIASFLLVVGTVPESPNAGGTIDDEEAEADVDVAADALADEAEVLCD